MKEYYKLTKEELFSELRTDKNGLSATEAKKRLEEHGKNALLEAKKKSEEKEKKLSDAVLSVKGKFGKNAVIRGLSLLDKATARDRNSQIGGHKSGEVPSAKKDNSDV